jgi:hypothetical protein
MIDLENLKDSILSDMLWTERELNEIVRQAINKITNKMTFDYDLPKPVDTRSITIKAIISCPGGNQPEVFAAIKKHLKGLDIAMTFDNTSNEQMLKIWFEVPRWRPFDSNP